MKPYYEDEWATIYLADCREVIPTLDPIDLIVTDPPYGLAYNAGNDMASQREAIFHDQVNGPPRPIAADATEIEAEDLLRGMLVAAKGRMAKGGECCCCCCCGGGGPKPLFARWTLLLDEILDFKQAVVWDKGGLGMGIHFRRSYEFMLIAQNGSPAHRWNGGKSTSNVWRIPKIIPSALQHPTAKPAALMAKCIRLFSNAGDLVVDPFMGHGPTLRAAKDMGRRAVGIDVDEEHCAVAAERLRQEVFDFGQ